MVERKVQNLLDNSNTYADALLTRFFGNAPAIKNMALNLFTAKKKELLPKINEYCDLIVEASCLDESGNLESYINNAETLLNEYLANFINKHTGFPGGTVIISLQSLFGADLLKL